MPAGWVSAAVGIYGAISSADAADSANSTNQQSIAASQKAAQDALDFDKQKYEDNKPYTDALQQQAIQTNTQQQQIAAQQASNSQQAWTQNQQASAGVAPTVGLNALGGQYLSPAEQQELLGLQQYLTQQGTTPTTAAPKPVTVQQPALSSTDAARLAELQQAQKSATMSGGNPGQPQGYWQSSDSGDQFVQTGPATGGSAGTSSFTPAMEAELKALTDKQTAATKTMTTQPVPPGTADQAAAAPGLYNGMTPDQVQARILELQQTANQGAQQRELDKAGLVTGTASKYADQVVGLGNSNADSILANSQTLQDQLNAQGTARDAEIRATAKQRADDFEQKAGTQANAAISTSADMANRQLLRLGGDPNKMAAMGLDTANNQQLARISAGNQIAGYNIASLNAADDAGRAQLYGAQDQAFGIQSAALDAARASRTGAQQAAIGMNFGAAQTSDTLTGNAKDVADAKLNSLAQGSLNQTQGFANTSGQQALGAVSAGTAGVNNLNTASNGGLQAAALVNTGTAGVINAGKSTYQPISGVSGVANGLGAATAAGQSIYNSFMTPTSGTAGLASAEKSMSNSEGEYPIGLG